MGRPTKPPTRDELIKRIRSLEAKLSHVHDDRQTTDSSVRHAADQVAFWRCRQALASMERWDAEPDQRTRLDVEARKCTEMAVEWERRKAEATKVIEMERTAERLASIERKIDEQRSSAGAFKDIAT